MNSRMDYSYGDYLTEMKNKINLSIKMAKENILESKIRNKRVYDTNLNPIEIKPNDLVMEKVENRKRKSSHVYSGPYRVISVPSNEYVIIMKGNKEVKVNKNRLKLAEADYKDIPPEIVYETTTEESDCE